MFKRIRHCVEVCFRFRVGATTSINQLDNNLRTAWFTQLDELSVSNKFIPRMLMLYTVKETDGHMGGGGFSSRCHNKW